MFAAAFTLVYLATAANAYWLMGANFLVNERIDPIVEPGKVSKHVHGLVGGSNLDFNVSTAKLRESECSSVPIKEDHSLYWFPSLYFQYKNGSFESVGGGAVIYYLFGAGGEVAFPDDFRMVAGNPTLRSFNESSYSSQAVTYKCLDFDGTHGGTTDHNELPRKECPSGIRAQINFPSCWNGENDSPDHQSHMAYPSEGPDKGKCNDPAYPKTTVRIFLEVYWSGELNSKRSEAMDPEQPYVFSYGDPTGYGYHADFYNGWDDGVLAKAIDQCKCNDYGDPTCCNDAGVFTYYKDGTNCKITKAIDEEVLGVLDKLPGNNPVQKGPSAASMYQPESVPGILSPVYVYTGNEPDKVGTVVSQPSDVVHDGSSASGAASSASATATPATPSGAANNSARECDLNKKKRSHYSKLHRDVRSRLDHHH